MTPIKILLAHRPDWYRGPARIDGFFQYPVPEFIVTHLKLPKAFRTKLFEYRQFDILFLDDGKYKDYSRFIPAPPHDTYPIPQVAMYALYPTLTPGHFRRRVERARNNADFVLVDHDNIKRWKMATGRSCFRMPYCVDENRYCDRGYIRDIDVGFYCVYGWNKERPAMDRWLESFCQRQGYTYHTTHGKSIGEGYADLLSRTKVVVHMNRTPNTRAPRIFDVSASGAAILTNPTPPVSGEQWPNHPTFTWPCSESYTIFDPKEIPVYTDIDCAQVADSLNWLLMEDNWKRAAQPMNDFFLQYHSWEVRASLLYSLLCNLYPRFAQ